MRSSRVPAPRALPEELDVEEATDPDPDTGEQWADACGEDPDENFDVQETTGDDFDGDNQTVSENADPESSSPNRETDPDPVYLNLAAPASTPSDSPTQSRSPLMSPAPPPPLAPKPSFVLPNAKCSEQLPERHTPQPSQMPAPFSVPLPERGTPVLFAVPDSSPLLVPVSSASNYSPHVSVSPIPQLKPQVQSPPPQPLNATTATDSGGPGPGDRRDRPQSEFDWLEIIEPTRQRRMYANLRTGECRWRLPSAMIPRTYALSFLIPLLFIFH